nr:MAG TPA: hypothetical protein [Caudoviricetes sp.]
MQVPQISLLEKNEILFFHKDGLNKLVILSPF